MKKSLLVLIFSSLLFSSCTASCTTDSTKKNPDAKNGIEITIENN
ncbi:MAG: hypothetical protein QMC12_02890 [Flavobacteriales bacterium]|jgi:PBP1b-binding outer membrane lipoprotein LpoB